MGKKSDLSLQKVDQMKVLFSKTVLILRKLVKRNHKFQYKKIAIKIGHQKRLKILV